MTEPAALIRSAFDRLNDHDLPGYFAYLADDVVTVNALGRFEGKAAVVTMIEDAFATTSDHWRTVERLLVSGDNVVVWLRFGATVVATGRSFELEACTVFEIRAGLISAVTEYADWTPAIAAMTS